MIRKLKRRFIVLATVSMFLLMTVLVLIMNIVNYSSVVSECDATLDMLSDMSVQTVGGTPPEIPEDADIPEQPAESMLSEPAKRKDELPSGMSPEVPYESRYFIVFVMPDGSIVDPDFSRIVTVDLDSSGEYVESAAESDCERGFADRFRYLKTDQGEVTRIIFLDCGRKLDAFTDFLRTSIITGFAGGLAVFLAFLLAAGRIVNPIAESYEKQKRFISDAGHEIKTPLTVINANVDLLTLDGESEELDEIRAQTKRLTELTNNLVLLSKMEETEHRVTKVEFPLSDIVSEAVHPFKAPAAAKNITLTTDIKPDITLQGSPEEIRRLVSVLIDNAVKYANDNGAISVSLAAARRGVALIVENTVTGTIDRQSLPYVFDRFYRTDASRNSSTGGHGIGLSIAKAITSSHGGTIAASTADGTTFRVTVNLPCA